MTTELVWSTVKPTFQEVKGKEIVIVRGNQLFTSRGNYTVRNRDDYASLFNDTFICYADLTATVSPLPLWGRMPRVISTIIHMEDKTIWSVYYEHHNVYFQLNNYATQELAILAWNRIAEALNEVEK